MKKILSFLVFGFIIALVLSFFVGFSAPKSNLIEKNSYIRIHIRANSDSVVDQDIKYAVRDAVVNFLTPKIAVCETLSQAHCQIKLNISQIDAVANAVLAKNGLNYVAKAKLNDEYFPTRAYGDVVLDGGLYDALIIDLGRASGQNWWCVVYPPLCFVGAENTGSNSIIYKSKLVEILKKYSFC